MEVNARTEIIQRGRRASDLLENETLNECLNEIMNRKFIEFASTHAEDKDIREKIWATGQALGEVKQVLSAWIDSGRVEQENKEYDDND